MEINELLGKTLTEITGADIGGDEIVFICSDGTNYKLYHEQDCCESVTINDIVGYITDLLGSPLTMAEEISSEEEKSPREYFESYTWTFYKLATVKGYVTIKWLGESNGYYSESVTFDKIP